MTRERRQIFLSGLVIVAGLLAVIGFVSGAIRGEDDCGRVVVQFGGQRELVKTVSFGETNWAGHLEFCFEQTEDGVTANLKNTAYEKELTIALATNEGQTPSICISEPLQFEDVCTYNSLPIGAEIAVEYTSPISVIDVVLVVTNDGVEIYQVIFDDLGLGVIIGTIKMIETKGENGDDSTSEDVPEKEEELFWPK